MFSLILVSCKVKSLSLKPPVLFLNKCYSTSIRNTAFDKLFSESFTVVTAVRKVSFFEKYISKEKNNERYECNAILIDIFDLFS